MYTQFDLKFTDIFTLFELLNIIILDGVKSNVLAVIKWILENKVNVYFQILGNFLIIILYKV